ncbi:superoxide dismutase, Fe-Mn family [Haladaptatus litoreus]|uniref:Superoxide dismutase n=1 Tax=Haladaptatus litoreus TaxID=553468 RepID=A0A1N6WZ27_9EURY|nr:superoxide dismutase [Haladaptatus litoreus]SIQ95271.1 superoxide dismutase, Fe-Mn family [Haladaptatus litoreus]
MATYELPELPYDYDALEPTIDARIMELHHDIHHQGYVDGANAALDKLETMRDNDDWGDVKGVERNLAFNLSGHINHSVFWENMSPDGGGEPGGELADAMDEHFGGFDQFKSHFSAAAKGVEGSGWGMLVYDYVADKPIVTMAENHQNQSPMAEPLLVLDVWEHAYYLQYENNRGEYVDNFWDVVNWDDVAERLDEAQSA